MAGVLSSLLRCLLRLLGLQNGCCWYSLRYSKMRGIWLLMLFAGCLSRRFLLRPRHWMQSRYHSTRKHIMQ